MSVNPITRFDLVDGNDMTPLIRLSSAYGRSFKPVFNGPGTFSATLPLDSEEAYLIANRSTGCLITRNERPIWSGGVTTTIKSAQANTMQITATGWLEEFDHRYVRKDEEATLAFVGVIGGQIIMTLIDTCNAQLDSYNVVRPLRVRSGVYSDTQVRTRAYHVGDNYGNSIRELTTIENGGDLKIDPLTRVLSVVPPTAYADDQDAILRAGVMLEEWNSISDVSDVNIAGAFANAELVVKRSGLTSYQLTPNSYNDLPRPYDDFEWGDKAYFSADKGALRIVNQAVRLFAGTINYTDEGDEVISELEVAMSG